MDFVFPIYEQVIKPRKYNKPQNLFQLAENEDHSGIKKWFRYKLPGEYDKQYHVLMEKEAISKLQQVGEERMQLINKEFQRLFGRNYRASDHRIPVVVREEFSPSVKKKLTELYELSSKYHSIAYAHKIMIEK